MPFSLPFSRADLFKFLRSFSSVIGFRFLAMNTVCNDSLKSNNNQCLDFSNMKELWYMASVACGPESSRVQGRFNRVRK